MHVLVCMCSNVRQFSQLNQTLSFHSGSMFIRWPCFVSHNL